MRVSLQTIALALVVVGLLGCRHEDPPPPPVETVPALQRLRIIFPEGFTRAQMVEPADSRV